MLFYVLTVLKFQKFYIMPRFYLFVCISE